MSKQSNDANPTSVPADQEQWSEASKRSYSYTPGVPRHYVDQPYECWRCGAACVFTAQDQKHTYEVKKASINERRKFCAACWAESLQLRAALAEHESRWAAGKSSLQADADFLRGWLELLDRFKTFEPYRQDVARVNMLRGLLLKLE